jgi:hypothetical protein
MCVRPEHTFWLLFDKCMSHVNGEYILWAVLLTETLRTLVLSGDFVALFKVWELYGRNWCLRNYGSYFLDCEYYGPDCLLDTPRPLVDLVTLWYSFLIGSPLNVADIWEHHDLIFIGDWIYCISETLNSSPKYSKTSEGNAKYLRGIYSQEILQQ